MLKHLVLLEQPYDPSSGPDLDANSLISYALTCSDYWAGLAVDWLIAGHDARGHLDMIRTLAADNHRPQALRHKAYGLAKMGTSHDRLARNTWNHGVEKPFHDHGEDVHVTNRAGETFEV